MRVDNNHGGPAFPTSVASDDEGGLNYGPSGMSLRDWFAGMALCGIYAQSSDGVVRAWGKYAIKQGETSQENTYAAIAYSVADAMLDQRKKP